eukprot:scaffold16591_cov368-Ochromonas_danica.AAC.1
MADLVAAGRRKEWRSGLLAVRSHSQAQAAPCSSTPSLLLALHRPDHQHPTIMQTKAATTSHYTQRGTELAFIII